MSDVFGLEIEVGLYKYDWYETFEPVFPLDLEEHIEEIRPIICRIEQNVETARLVSKIKKKVEEMFSESVEMKSPNRKYKHRGMTLRDKIWFYKQLDIMKFGGTGDLEIDDVIDQLNKQMGRCYICGDAVLLEGSAGCCYLISVDRIDNHSPHNISNCLISCSYCNRRPYMYKKYKKDCKKICAHGCHNAERDLPLKESVLEKITEEKIPEQMTW